MIRTDCLGLFDSEVVQISDIGHDIFNLKWKFTFSGGTDVEREALDWLLPKYTILVFLEPQEDLHIIKQSLAQAEEMSVRPILYNLLLVHISEIPVSFACY